ncbi:MAG: hypothetical protein KJO07_01290, partial [Deltaproteobacteria bacterium]|nr:hypothetical protein [Deltaproteobacteria bacterium]
MQWSHSVADDAPIALVVFAGVRGSHASIELLVDEVPVPGPDCAVGTSGADGIEISTYGWLVVIPESPGATTLPMELSLNEDVDALVGFAQNLEPSILEIAS